MSTLSPVTTVEGTDTGSARASSRRRPGRSASSKAARAAADRDAEDAAHRAVDAAKQALGERGPVWWTDGAPDLNRKMARNTAYAEWFASVGG